MDSYMSGVYHVIRWAGPLSSVQQTLYNGHRMVCVNCVPSNQNITVQTETRSSMTPQLYVRDVAITAVICFIGGVGLTLLVVFIYYRVCRRKKLRESKRQKEEEEGSSTIANHLDASEKTRDFFLQANSSQSGDREAVALDTRTYSHGGPFRSRAVENLSHFRCPDCGTERQKGMGLNSIRGNMRINGGMEAEQEIEKKRMRMMAEEERWRLGTQQRKLSRDIPNELLSRSNTDASSHPWKETFSQRPETNRKMGERTDMEGKSRGHETFHCESCHRTYRPPEQNMTQVRIHTNMGDSARFDGFPSQYRQIDRGRNVNHNQLDILTNAERRRETRNVTFDLASPRTLEQVKSQGEEGGRGKRKEEEGTDRDKERGRVRRHKAQSSRLLKVKLNLNPLGKRKVHPKKKTEQGHSEKSNSKKGKDKRQDGKEREEKEGKEKSGKKTKGSSEKMKKSTAKRLTEDGEDEKEEEDQGGGQKSKMSPKQKKTTSKSGQLSQGSTEGDQGQNTNSENSQTGNTTNTADQSASAIAAEQGQILQGGSIQYQGAGLVLGSAHLSSQHPLSLSTTDRNHTTNRSLLGSVGSQLTGSSLSLQGGNLLLSTAAQGSNPLFAGYPANSVAPRIAISGPNMAPSGAPDSFSSQAGVGLASPATSLLANAVHANPLQASATHTSPLHTSQLAGLASMLAANPTVPPVQSLLQSHPPPGSSSLVTKFDPAQETGLQTGDVLQLLSESQAPQTNKSLTLPTQGPSSGDGLFGVTPQAPGPMTTADNLPNNNSQTEMGHVPAGTTVNVSAGGVALTELLAAGGSMQAADVTVSGVSAPSMSTQSVSSTGEAAAALLQQEYLSEEGGSSPRRKLRLVLPEKASSRPPTALERKIR